MARAALAAVVLVLSSLVHRAHAEWPEVPIRLQVELLAKVVAYDRSFAARAEGLASVLVVVREGDLDSERVGAEVLAALKREPVLGRVPHEAQLVRYASPRALAAACREQRATVVYLTAGLGDEIAPIAQALKGVEVLTVAAIARYVDQGAVLGFSAQSGKPTIVINRLQAKQQAIDFRADLLRLAKVVP